MRKKGISYIGHGLFIVSEAISADYITPHEAGNTKFFVVKGKGDNRKLDGVYASTGKKVLSDVGEFYFYYAGNNAVYYAKHGGFGWGLMSLTGTAIVPYSGKFLEYIDPETNMVGSYNEYQIAPKAYISYYYKCRFADRFQKSNLCGCQRNRSSITQLGIFR